MATLGTGMVHRALILLWMLPGVAGAATVPADGYLAYSGTATALHSSAAIRLRVR